jgi:hypothetical protein
VRSGVAGVLPKSRSADRGRAVGIAKQDQMEVGKTDPGRIRKLKNTARRHGTKRVAC